MKELKGKVKRVLKHQVYILAYENFMHHVHVCVCRGVLTKTVVCFKSTKADIYHHIHAGVHTHTHTHNTHTHTHTHTHPHAHAHTHTHTPYSPYSPAIVYSASCPIDVGLQCDLPMVLPY